SLAQLWTCDRDGGNARQLTQTGERNSGARWSPDGTQIAFVSDRVSKSGLFVMSMSGGEARELTRHAQGISSLSWSPDGSQIAYVTVVDPDNVDEATPEADAAPPVRVTRRIDYKQDGRGYLGDKRNQIFVVDVASGERKRLTTTPNDHGGPQWSPDGKQLAVALSMMNGMHSRLALIDVESGAVEHITPEDGNISTWSWSPDGQRILYSGDTDMTWQTDLFVYDVASGQTTRLTDDLECLPVGAWEGAPAQPVWLDDRQVLFHAVRAGGSGLYVADSERGAVERVVWWQAQHSGMSTDAAHRYVVQTRNAMDAAGQVAVYDMQSGEQSIIVDPNVDVLAEHPAALWERIDVERGGQTIEAWLLKPFDFDESKKYPVVLDIHGGPNGHYGYSLSPNHQVLATAGYLVVYSNPRGSSSYGRTFTQMVTEDWGGEDFQDLMGVIDEVLKRPYADAERTGVTGYSYGGYMTAWTIGQTQRFKAAVCGAPCFDLESMYGTSDISHVFGELQWGGQPHVSTEWYAAHSPSTFAHRATTPTLIIHGEADERCPIGQGEQMFVALTKAGCETEFARYPGASHGFRRGGHAEHRRDCWQRTLDWFDTHL
ncbi:MAG: S9 family peptidase, partial [Thermomicrobiales bacterium]|nr:S9 family peptidase [Thermomicrobiales bacterium]